MNRTERLEALSLEAKTDPVSAGLRVALDALQFAAQNVDARCDLWVAIEAQRDQLAALLREVRA